jgi:DNA-binding MarR family transcriptional regulator
MVSAQTMNSVLHTLELDGYIERRPHPDSRRADSWTLTARGLERLERAREVGSAVFGRMLGTLCPEETAAFTDYLRRCIVALDDGSGDASQATVPERPRTARAQRRQKAGVNSTRNV